jgi:proton-translocating NAD(P)+ transhydrogenase subunit alpha
MTGQPAGNHLRYELDQGLMVMQEPEFVAQYRVLSTQYSVLKWLHYPHGPLALVSALMVTGPLHAEPNAASGNHAVAASDWPAMLFVFMLASFIGLGVITRVSRLLHTPLMSLTNAISAIAVVRAITTAGAKHPFPITLLAAIALFASMTNIVSGFLITDRMLKMFKRPERQ